MSMRSEIKQSLFMNFCTHLSALSTCKRSQLGCIIVPPDYSQILSIGYNGQPRGLNNEGCQFMHPGNCGCVHAEMNALLKCVSSEPCIMFCSESPCVLCAGMIINYSKITAVIFKKLYRNQDGLKLLRKAGIGVNHFQ